MTETAARPLPSFAVLREIAARSPVAHACIRLLQTEVTCTEWDIVPAYSAASLVHGISERMRKFGERRQQAVRFFRNPDPEYGTWRSWAERLVREILETDSLALYVRHASKPGCGLLGSDLAALELLDGATLAPPLDAGGDVIQTTGAVHRVRVADWGCDDGPHETSALWVSKYTSRRVLYRPMRAPVIQGDPLAREHEQPREPFGRSPLEDAIVWDASGAIDLPATEAKIPAAFGISPRRIGMQGDDPGFPLDEQIRAHLKGIFDFVLHDLCDAPDLEWTWLKEAGLGGV